MAEIAQEPACFACCNPLVSAQPEHTAYGCAFTKEKFFC